MRQRIQKHHQGDTLIDKGNRIGQPPEGQINSREKGQNKGNELLHDSSLTGILQPFNRQAQAEERGA